MAQIWNSGTSAPALSISDDAAWLSPSLVGPPASEHATGVLRLDANPAHYSVSNGVNTAAVTVSQGAQTCRVQVVLTRGVSAGTSARFLGGMDFPNDAGTWKNRLGSQGYDACGRPASAGVERQAREVRQDERELPDGRIALASSSAVFDL